MDAYFLDWANLLLRWLHVITAIAWVGSSFYFVFLDNNLQKPESPDLLEKGVGGAMWAVHGGGFYTPQKYLAAPKKIHTHLHWFYWESYTTWLTGFALFSVSYLWQAQTYMVDPNLVAWTRGKRWLLHWPSWLVFGSFTMPCVEQWAPKMAVTNGLVCSYLSPLCLQPGCLPSCLLGALHSCWLAP